jgi:hypothetical protein
MGHWNYRIMKRKNEEGEFDYGIHEVYYDENGKVKGWTERSMTTTCDSEENLKFDLERMIKAFEKETLIDEEE